MDEETTTTGGAMHGGALMSLADTIGGVVAFLNLPEGAGTSTISSSTVFLRGLREGTLTATGRLIHKGRTTIVADDRRHAPTSDVRAVANHDARHDGGHAPHRRLRTDGCRGPVGHERRPHE